MSKVDDVQKQIAKLESEHAAFQAEIDELAAALDEQRADRAGLWAAIERGDSRAIKTAETLDNGVSDLAQQIERKRAALAAVESDLRRAHDDLRAAERDELAAFVRADLEAMRERAGAWETSTPAEQPKIEASLRAIQGRIRGRLSELAKHDDNKHAELQAVGYGGVRGNAGAHRDVGRALAIRRRAIRGLPANKWVPVADVWYPDSLESALFDRLDERAIEL